MFQSVHKKCFCKKLLRIIHLSVLNIVGQESFFKAFIFIFNTVVSNNVMYYSLGFDGSLGLMVSQNDLEHVFQPSKSGKYVQNKSSSIMAYIVYFCNPVTVIKFELFLECRLGNEVLVGYYTIA